MLNFMGSAVLSKLDDKIFEYASNTLKMKIEKELIHSAITDSFGRWFKTKQMVQYREEIDFGGLENYIDSELIEDLFKCCTESSRESREYKYKTILEKAYSFTRADSEIKKYNVRQFIDKARSIVQSIASKSVDDNVKISIYAAVDSITNGEKTANYTIYQKGKTLEESIKRHKKRIENQPLISSVPERLSFGALFCETDKDRQLYTDQKITMRSTTAVYYSINQLFTNKKEQTLLVTGEAGSGKSTGLKALFITNHTDTCIFYATVKEYINSKKNRSEMLNYIRRIINEEIAPSGKLIILDGLDEAFANNPSGAISFVESIIQSNAVVWIGCRTNYYDQISVSLQEHFDDVAVMDSWSEETAIDFVRRYSNSVNDPHIMARFAELIPCSSKDNFIKNNPFFLTLFLFAIDRIGITDIPRNEYELFDLFLKRWIESERIRGTSTINDEQFFNQLYELANAIYSGKELVVGQMDNSVQGLVLSNRAKATSFIHWDLCAFLISKQIISATIEGDLSLVNYYPQAFLDDVTNMTWDQFNHFSADIINKMYDNLFDVYRQIYEQNECILSQNARKRILEMDAMEKLKLKDEIIYFILRLPMVNKMPFFTYASSPERITHPIIELGLAYGIGMSMSHPFALQFAKKLRPDTPEAILNRSWTVAFFGDQKTINIYDFKENPVASWSMARNARLERFKKNNEKAYRYRIFDIPLLLCFYVSRDWTGCISSEDLEIIKNCDVDWPHYSTEERLFLKRAKKELVEEYSFFLEYQKSFS